MTNLIRAIGILAIAGVVALIFNTLVTMDARFKIVINALIGLVAFLWILGLFGIFPLGH